MDSKKDLSAKLYTGSAVFSWLVVAAGQWLFVLYIVGLYVISGLRGDFTDWNQVLPHGYEKNNLTGNVILGAHLVLAAIISALGSLQLVPYLRSHAPRFHRISGRVYIITAFIMATSGLYLILSGRKLVGDYTQYLAITINALIIICAAALTIRYAIAKNFIQHRRWALRLFWAVSGVWLVRVGLMCWLVIFQKPVGFDPKTFSGPFLTVLAVSVYILPLLILEAYFRVKNTKPLARYLFSVSLIITTLLMALGIFGATMGIWIPRVF
ncbi:DUF2306 domain-containing protein [Gilvimarinus agarilyticus]|uniref:DUF2306 domain-containing protein n=1 Tax=Gilvimarinus sp. 2_MG-2023 TaxID=3062666 RepID=UPI001C09ACF9|nr:DUF2306 domain-containing protein [Gilvimarinus sp. 2_MG-2023]MBU2886795.1 DUF2306 domain-containing protein [Gilvimarinus agarilyticus]MDO6571459.1 DUF2306 domain-containing protein [Gilvimarinus sp. 2_MG-2023]